MIIFWHFVTKYAVSDCQWTVDPISFWLKEIGSDLKFLEEQDGTPARLGLIFFDVGYW